MVSSLDSERLRASTLLGIASMVIVLIFGCSTPPRWAPLPNSAVASILSIKLEVRPPVFRISRNSATHIYLVRIDEGDALTQKRVFWTNFDQDGYAYLMNVLPGRYAAVAARSRRQTGEISGVRDPVTGFQSPGTPIYGTYYTYLSANVIQQTVVEIGQGEAAFMGDWVVDEHLGSIGEKGDSAQVHYERLVSDNGGFPDDFAGGFHWRATKHESDQSEAAYARFMESSRETLIAANWAGIIADLRVAGGVAPAPAMEAREEGLADAERLSLEAASLYQQARYSEALSLAERALAIEERVRGSVHPGVADRSSSLAALYQAMGEHDRAEELHQRVLAIREEKLGRAHPDFDTALNDLATLYHETGDYAKAEDFYSRALAIREMALGPTHPGVAFSLNNLAALYYDKGEYVRAEPLYERALAITEREFSPVDPRVASVLGNLAELYRAKGDYDRAEPLYLRALAILEGAHGPTHPEVAAAVGNLAVLYHEMANFSDAEPLYLRALAIQEKALGEAHFLVASTLSNLAALYLSMGDYARAEPLCLRSLSIAETSLGPSHPNVAAVLDNLARVRLFQGEAAKAAPLFERALAIRENALGDEHPVVATSLSQLGRLHWAASDEALAETYFYRASEVEERQISLLLPTGSEGQARAFMRTLAGSTDRILSFQSTRPSSSSTTRLALTTVLRRKGRVLDVLSGRLGALRQVGEEERASLDLLLERRDALARRVLQGPRATPPDLHRKHVQRLRDEVDVLERDAVRRGGALRSLTAAAEVDDVQAQIPAGGALIEIVEYQQVDAWPLSEGASSVSRLGAFVLRDHGDPHWVSIGDTGPIQERVGAFRKALVDPSLPRAKLRPLARELHELLIAPLGPHLRGVDTLLLAPDGVLNLVPFGALVDAGGVYLIERYALSYLTSGRDLLRVSFEGAAATPPMIIGSPDFDMNPSAATVEASGVSSRRSTEIETGRFAPLPGTHAEALSVGQTLGVTPLFGADATETAIREQRAPRVLHIATHGFFLSDVSSGLPTERGIMLPTDTESTGSAFGSSPLSENPLLRSGLALAGANRPSDRADDGILTALEMAGLDLFGTKLVVLSACETGLGEIAVGEGVYGLRRALVIAGAESQLVSLWKVDDEATRDLMTAYYRRLLQGDGRAAALRKVQLAMLAEGRAPYYWASFIPIGAWGSIGLDSAEAQSPVN